ncbi:putative ribonuclease H-like domain-containing protein [Tanacetum coccineum]
MHDHFNPQIVTKCTYESSTNDVSTAYSVSNPFGQNSQCEQTSSYSLLANQSSCPQLDYEDLEQLDEYDLEEMDLKWQVAMISMRMKKFYKKTGRKLQFDAKEPVGFDKTKVECYNCHKTGHFARECRTKGNQDSRRRDAWNSGNKDGRRSGKQEDSKALVTIDGEGVDWTSHSKEEEDYALMAYNSSGSDTEVTSCSNECKESYDKLKKLYDAQREQLSDASIEIKAYTQGLKKVEAQLVAHQQGQLWYEQKIKFMKIDLDDKTDVLTYHKKLLAEAMKEKEDLKAKVEKWHNSSKNLGKLINTQMSANDKFGLGYGDHRYDGILSYENEVLQSVFKGKESDFENPPLYDRFVTAGGMNVVPPPMTGNYMPSGPDIEIDYSQFTYGPKQTQPSESETQTSEFDTCESNISTETPELVSEPVVNESNVACQPKVWSDAPIIEEYESDSEDEYVSIPTKEQETPSFANQQVKTPRETVKNHFTHSKNPKVDKKELGYGFTARACFVCGSLNHLIRDCDFHEKRMAKQAELNNRLNRNSSQREIRPIWNNVQRVNNQNQFVPTAVLTRTGKIPVNTARASGTKNVSTWPFNEENSSLEQNFQTKSYSAKVNAVSAVGGKGKLLLSPQQVVIGDHKDTTGTMSPNTMDYPHRALQNKGIVDSGCSRHMTGNKAYLAEYQDFNGGPIAFGGSKGYITGKGKIKTRKLDFEDVCFVKELQHFNLFSVSQMCDKKNKVLFTDSECLVLSPEFKLPDANQVLLRIPRQNNMYSFNLENIVPSGGLACLIAKATIDESNKWHRRLGHVNFKNLNKLVKGNLVRGLPSKIFQNDHTCVACQKGKQHKASCKAKSVSSISHSLQLLHMDLFGPTSVRSLNHKSYCLVITDDFSRFSWVFFLRTKDETSGILKDFIRQIENQLNQKVKTIRCDNGTEFKNRDFIEFCGSKGIKREYSNARTPQQNGVAERKNMTLIEAARTMLADSFLPNTFWAEAVSTACYVLNRRSRAEDAGATPHKHPDLKTYEKPVDTEDQVFLDELERLKRQEKDANDAAVALRKEFAQQTEDLLLQAGAAKASSTNIFNTVSTPVSTASPYGGLSFTDPTNPDQDDSEIPALEDIYQNPTDGIFTNSSYDDEGAVADFTNLETVINVSPIPTSRINSFHPLTLILGDPKSAVQTRSKVTKSFGAYAFVDAMQEELLQFKIQKVWILVDLPYGKKAIGTKWVYRNKKDKRGVVVRNKPRLVAQGHRQEEGIDYDEVFAPVARIEAIRIFLAFASYMGFIVYQMDVKKKCFLMATLMRSHVSQPPDFLDLNILREVYKVVEKLSRVTPSSQSLDKYAAEILKKFDFVNVKTASTPIETQKPLVKDEEASDVDVHLYRSMIGSLMYLTASRPDIMFVVCACSRFQVTPKTSHLSAVKRIFRRLHFLANRKKQTIVATSTTEAEYVAAASCCGQVLWIQNQMLDYGFNFMNTKIYIDNESTICIVKNPIYHSKTKHIAIRHHFIRDAYEKKLIQVLKIHTDDNVADLLTKAFDVSSSLGFIESLGRALDGTEALMSPKLFILWLTTVSTDSAELVPMGKVSTAIETLKKNTAKGINPNISPSPTITHSTIMVVLESCPKHNMVAYLEKTEGNVEFHEIIDFLTRSSIHHALTVSPVVSTTFVKQFWTSAKCKIINNVRHITAKVAGKPVSIYEASIRSDLLFDDADGIDSLPN